MDPDSKMFSSYGAVMSGDWKSVIDHYQLNFSDLLRPVTSSKDTALHIAVGSQKEQPLKDLLAILVSKDDCTEEFKKNILQQDLLKRQNKFGNTVLHEATIYGNFEAVKLLVELCPDLVSITNIFGETPLFKAAEFAEAEIVKFLLDSPLLQTLDDHGCLQSIHRQRSSDDVSILTAAIMGQRYETALLLLDADESLHSLKDKSDITALQLLAHTPSAFESGYPMEVHERLIYCCLPVTRPHKVKLQEETLVQARQGSGDLESGLGRNGRGGLLNYLNVLAKGYWPAWLQRVWNEKRKHVFALTLAEILIKKDTSWNSVEGQEDDPEVTLTGLTTSQIEGGQDKEEEQQGLGRKKDEKRENEGPSVMQTSPYQNVDESNIESEQGDREITFKGKEIEVVRLRRAQTSATKSLLTSKDENPLFTATRNGIEEIVRVIVERHPQAIEHLNDMGQSILVVAVIHRNKEIFSLVKQKKIPFARLRRLIDKKGNTLLHHVADMKHYRGGTKPGPVLQLQEELQWFEQVRNVIPSHYVTLRNEKGETAEELFKTKHQEQLNRAQKWIKDATNSCSAVAIAIVVFSAAYDITPGYDEATGKPIFIRSPYFMAFTVSNMASLAGSLTSLVVFLSLLTSPSELQDFHVSHPRKLIIGFTFLFLSVIATALSFGAAIFVLKSKWIGLPFIAVFLPVLVFAMKQFRRYFSFMGFTLNILKITAKALPSCLVRRLPGGKKLF